jgi:hypothetical protein
LKIEIGVTFINLRVVKVSTYSILFLVTFSMFVKLQVCINYFVNQNYYAQVLCKNKSVRNSCCKGKCVMEKELSALQAKEDNEPKNNKNNLLKITKSEEATCYALKMAICSKFICLTFPVIAPKLQKGALTSLIKPPTIKVMGQV